MGDVSESGTWVNRQTRPLGEVDSGYTSFKEGDVLFAKITPCMENGKGCHARNLVNGHGFGSTEFHVLRAIDGVSDARFLYHWTRTPMLRLKAESAMSGSAGQQRVSTWFFDEFKVPRIPLPEQRRIADVLDTVDAAIQETDAVVEKQEQVKTGLLQDLLTRGLDAGGRLRDPEREPEAFRETEELGITPVDWKVVELRDLGSWGGGATPRKSNQEYWHGNTPWISPKDMGDSVIRRTEDYVTSHAISDTNLSIFGPGSVVVVFRSGILRHTFPVATADRPFTVNQDMKVLTPGIKVSDDFALHLIQYLGPKVLRRATKVGTTVESVDTDSFMSLCVGVPPLPEQRRITQRIDAVRTLSEELGEEIAKLNKLKVALMQDLLTGRVRVPEAEDRVDEVIA
jgi:type I restriction enzyme S subunit